MEGVMLSNCYVRGQGWHSECGCDSCQRQQRLQRDRELAEKRRRDAKHVIVHHVDDPRVARLERELAELRKATGK